MASMPAADVWGNVSNTIALHVPAVAPRNGRLSPIFHQPAKQKDRLQKETGPSPCPARKPSSKPGRALCRTGWATQATGTTLTAGNARDPLLRPARRTRCNAWSGTRRFVCRCGGLTRSLRRRRRPIRGARGVFLQECRSRTSDASSIAAAAPAKLPGTAVFLPRCRPRVTRPGGSGLRPAQSGQ